MAPKMMLSLMLGAALAITPIAPELPTAQAASVAAAAITAKPATAEVYIDGARIAIQGYSINGNNYFKLRDLAYALKGSSKQFSVDWNEASSTIQLQPGKPYQALGGEMAVAPASASAAALSRAEVLVGNKKAGLTAYTIKGSNYFMLRELGDHLQFPVLWRPGDRSIRILTSGDVEVTQYSDLWTERDTDDYSYANWKGISKRHMFQSDGQIYILEDPGSSSQESSSDNALHVYAVAEPQTKAREVTINKELPQFGGFHAGEDGNYYIVYGQDNMEESKTKPVYRIVKYDRNWNKLAYTDITDVYATQPFHAGNLTMDSGNGLLVIHSTRLRYLTEDDGLRHQSNITFILDMKTMQVIRNGEQWPDNHVSHSFAAYVRVDGDKVVYADHGDAYPRSHILQVEQIGKGKLFTQLFAPVLGGITGDNYTGIYLGGLEVGSTNYIALSTYSKLYQSPVNSQNVRLDYILKDSEYDPYSATVWLTEHAPEDNVRINQSHLMKIDDHTFVVMWEEQRINSKSNTSESTLYYAVVNDTGKIMKKPTRLDGVPVPGNMNPLVDDRSVKWYYAQAPYRSGGANPVELYTLTIPSYTEQVREEGAATRPTSARSFPRIKQTLEQMGYHLVMNEEGSTSRVEINDSNDTYYFDYSYYNDQASQYDGIRGKFGHVFASNAVDMEKQLALAKTIIETDLNISLPGFVEQLAGLLRENSPLIVDQQTTLEYSMTINGVTLEISHYGYHPYYEAANIKYKN